MDNLPFNFDAQDGRDQHGYAYSLDSVLADLLATSSPHQRAVLSILAVSHTYNLPLASMLGRLASEAPGRFGRQAVYLASEVAQGKDAIETIQELSGLVTSPMALALLVARDEGNLPDFYRAVLQRSPVYKSDVDIDKEDDSRLSSLMMRGFFVLATVVFIALKVFPQIQAMFWAYEVELPSIMLALLAWSQLAAQLWFLFALVLIPFGIWWFRRYLRRLNPVTWRQPTVSNASRQRRVLAIASDGGEAADGLSRILKCASLHRFFPKLLKSLNRINGGQTRWSSLATEGLITKHESRALSGTDSGETQAWLLRWAANAHGERAKFKSRSLVNFVIWLGNILLALIVFWVAVAIFGALIQLMEKI